MKRITKIAFGVTTIVISGLAFGAIVVYLNIGDTRQNGSKRVG